jgi:hypothetical protein
VIYAGEDMMHNRESIKPRLTVKEQEFLDFAKNARHGERFVYASCATGRPLSLMRLAHDCFEGGLVHLVQERTAEGFAYVAVKRKLR